MSYKIDAVITWVDGNDPRHKAKREQYGDKKSLNRDDIAGSTRYTSIGEIMYCVASINRYAPWINKIYIVTDEQDPKLEEFMAKHFPEGYIPTEVVDHKVIFKGYEEYLPTFNSISIESMTWRIPGLSEHFIEFNDDLILAAPTKPEDFFPKEGHVICYGKRRSTFLTRISRLLKYKINGDKKVSFKESMLNAAKLVGSRNKFIMMYHTPKPILRSIYEKIYSENPEYLVHNIQHRFRHATQYNPEEMLYLKLYRDNRCIIRNANDELLYLMAKQNTEYIQRKLNLFSNNPQKKFGCFNSLDQASSDGQQIAIDWIEQRLKIDKTHNKQ